MKQSIKYKGSCDDIQYESYVQTRLHEHSEATSLTRWCPSAQEVIERREIHTLTQIKTHECNQKSLTHATTDNNKIT